MPALVQIVMLLHEQDFSVLTSMVGRISHGLRLTPLMSFVKLAVI